MKLAIASLLLAAAIVSPALAEGDLLFLNANGSTNISSLQLRIIPGTTNATQFRVVAQNDNISSLVFFGFSQQLNFTVTPANRTFLPQGDFQLVTVTVSVSNGTTAGFQAGSIMVLSTKPEQRILPVVVEIPSTTEWAVTPTNLSINVTPRAFGAINVSLVNTGNIPISGHVSRVDVFGLTYFDDSNFFLEPGKPVTRPLYYFLPNVTPGTYAVTLTFVDALSNARSARINFTLADETPPVGVVTFSRNETFFGQRLVAMLAVADDVNVSAAFVDIDAEGPRLSPRRVETNRFEIELENLTVGMHTLLWRMNDTSDNFQIVEAGFEVRPFEFLSAESSVDFLKFRPGPPGREIAIMNAISPVQGVRITLGGLNWDNQQNNTLIFRINGQPLSPGIPRQIDASGQVFLSVEGTNLTTFSGVLDIETPAHIRNPAPRITFRGEIANYSVTPRFNVTLPSSTAVLVCEPKDTGVYQTSRQRCEFEMPIDASKDQVAVPTSEAAINAERSGFNTEIRVLRADLGLAWNLIMVLVLAGIISIAVYVVKTQYLDQKVDVK